MKSKQYLFFALALLLVLFQVSCSANSAEKTAVLDGYPQKSFYEILDAFSQKSVSVAAEEGVDAHYEITIEKGWDRRLPTSSGIDDGDGNLLDRTDLKWSQKAITYSLDLHMTKDGQSTTTTLLLFMVHDTEKNTLTVRGVEMGLDGMQVYKLLGEEAEEYVETLYTDSGLY